jgi:hypothetical protein
MENHGEIVYWFCRFVAIVPLSILRVYQFHA